MGRSRMTVNHVIVFVGLLLFLVFFLVNSNEGQDLIIPQQWSKSRETPSPTKPLRLFVPPPGESSLLAHWNAPYHQQRDALRRHQSVTGSGPLEVHVFYTVECIYHSLWQAFMLEQSWLDVKQGGFITRIITSCKKHVNKQPFVAKSILPRGENLGIFFSPEFHMSLGGREYAPFQRPNAIWYWVNHSDLTEDVFVLVDPDMIFLHKLNPGLVHRGHPAAQYYEYMFQSPFDRYKCPLCPDPEVYSNGRKFNYSVGPPWMLHIDDLKLVLPDWAPLVGQIGAIDNNWIVEMFAYSVACARHGLAHKVIFHGQLEQPLQLPFYNADTHELRLDAQGGHKAALLHYCYTWEVGELNPKEELKMEQHERMVNREKQNRMPVIDYYHWSKYRTPTDWPGGGAQYTHNILSCNCPLMQEFHTKNSLPFSSEKWIEWNNTMFFIRTAIAMLNRVLIKWKLGVLNCSIPSLSYHQKQKVTRSAMPHYDWTSAKALDTDRVMVNLVPLLRTSHPMYWISNYRIRFTRSDLRTVDFESSSVAYDASYHELRLMYPEKVVDPPLAAHHVLLP